VVLYDNNHSLDMPILQLAVNSSQLLRPIFIATFAPNKGRK